MRNAHTFRLAVPLLIAALLAVLAFMQSFGFDTVPAILAKGLQPATFPRLITGLVLVLAVMAFIHDLRHPPESPTGLPNVFYLSVLLLAIFGALVAAGLFLLALMAATLGASLLWGERRPLVLISLALAPLMAIVLFDIVLEVRFPRSPLLNLYYRWS
ncbi:tripartite tricarboxylate transporter TctB family protein [Kushneria sinocarnis]|uniref:Tripartite tricarboxylate transporter TctB family protein n=1 Tax=Kushneria sinocarnis TaxID=595502 RepID=A0A420WWK0_9GAMM|nr:tripartite tricarboxylate transporter TctB family protein [Kushneria sinocarnis]RKR03497.1 tripartite tricarboxylate transporter TctB family protein [Kushneria sinocarnis]